MALNAAEIDWEFVWTAEVVAFIILAWVWTWFCTTSSDSERKVAIAAAFVSDILIYLYT